nr:hypothetical protein [Neobacillus sp. Marseille-Q6967]
MKAVYENSFDMNEWFVIISLLSLTILIWFLPKIFSLLEGTAYFLYGVFVVTFFDHTTSVPSWDLYDVNDDSKYNLMDFITYVMNGPYSYFFMYLYVKWNIRGLKNLFYIIIWSMFSVLIEWVGVKIGLYHYDKGYKMYWSFPIYMLVQTILIMYHHRIKRDAGG